MKWAAVSALLSAAALAMAQQPPASPEPPQVPPPSAAAPTLRTIEGTVLDKDDRPVPGAIILLKNTKTLGVRSYIAQNDGKFYFYGLSTDVNYELRAESNGLTSKTKTVNVFNSHKIVHLKLKLNKKKKT